MDLKIREMEMSLRKYVDGVDLPPEVKRIVLKGVYGDISSEADAAVRSELGERETAKGGDVDGQGIQ